MSDEPALLAAVCANPDEDTPRLVYADWLDEYGQTERAEFIRLQCAPEPDEAQEERVAELEERNRIKWLTGLPQFPHARWAFRRGFPERLEADGNVFLDRYGAFARVPWLRSLCLWELSATHVRDFVSRTWPPQWDELELYGLVRDAFNRTAVAMSVAALTKCAQLRQVRRLHLSALPLTDETVAALAESPNLDNLQRLQIDGDPAHPLFGLLRAKFGDRLAVG
jgi:uncharacterized protein (TIGR02996 family)